MANKVDLASLLSNNWYFHDKKQYEDIKTNSKKLLIKLGYNKTAAEKAAKLVKKLFEKEDSDEKLTQNTYSQLTDICDKIDMTLGRPLNSKNEIKWWRAVRHRNYLLGWFLLVNDQISKLGVLRISSAIFAANKLFCAGLAHDKKNWNTVREYCKDYWKIINLDKTKKFIEF